MAPRPIIESLVAHMKRDIAILEQLHILAQTQSLFLESGDLSGLTSVVEAKEKLVAQLVQAKSELATSLSQTDLKESLS
jgi:flagellar biosynthesis/type III secretory pathway chaperone